MERQSVVTNVSFPLPISFNSLLVVLLIFLPLLLLLAAAADVVVTVAFYDLKLFW
jgi:hypothetical protein